MERAPKLGLSLGLRLFLTQVLLLHVGNTMRDGRKLTTNDDSDAGFISVDCGATQDYLDEETGIRYETDTNFVETGANHMVAPSADVNDYPSVTGFLDTLRSFPEGKRNCYTLKPKQGKHYTYLIRAYFAYGNYDLKNQPPTFDLYLGVNRWKTVDLTNNYNYNYNYYYTEIIHTPTTDTVYVCLVQTVVGVVPFISALELRPLSNDIYQTSSPSQSLLITRARFDFASNTSATPIRYKDDIYDRIWVKPNHPDQEINGDIDIDHKSTNDSYKLPAEVLTSAAESFNLSYPIMYNHDFSRKDLNRPSEHYLYFHFLEVQKLPTGKKRMVNITVNDKNIISQPIILEYMKPQTVVPQNTVQGSVVRFSISAVSESDAPPILNAFEVYEFISPIPSPTDQRDVNAIVDIKDTYKISNLDWQGDPCVPTLAWDRLSCSSGINGNNARIISVNLSASKLAGQITTSFSQLTELESLDLSSNDLLGSVPEFLAELPTLKVLILAGNKLTGSIPKALEEKPDLQLSLEDNPDLCLVDPCKKHKFVVPLVASVSALVASLLVCLGIWIFKTKKLKVLFFFSTNEESLQLKTKAVSYSKILRITDNLINLIGEGGFGKVYLGTLKNNVHVAVKLLSQSSRQGFREFRSEVELLMVIHHRHLVSLIGYCEEGSVRGLIYEYMANGNLQQHLSKESPNVLKWNERLQIVLDAAHGLDYLHNGCKPPIIHRDLKTSNILLDENMQAKISDFGLSRALTNDIDTHLSTRPAGTPGYLDPEFQSSGNLTKKSDVYSFGIIMLELLTGQPVLRREMGTVYYILNWVTPKLEMGDIQSIIDPKLEGSYSNNSAWKLLEIAMSCTAACGVQRPDISQVVAELRECLALTKSMERNSTSDLDMASLGSGSGLIPYAR